MVSSYLLYKFSLIMIIMIWDTNGSPNPGQTIRPINNQQKKRTCRIVDFAIPADHRVKLNESEKKDKYLDLARELKKLRNMKVMVIPVVTGVLGTVTKGLVLGLEDLEIRGRMETIQTAALMGSTRIMRRVLESWCHSDSSEKPSANAGVKKSKRNKSNNNKFL